MISKISGRPWDAFAVTGYLVAVTALLFALFRHWGYDDPYITYRYAENLRAGLGFVYNPGQRVLSTTTPLFTLLLALLGWAWEDIPSLANLIGAFSLALGGLFLWDLARTWRSPLAAWTGLLLYPAFPLLVSTLGSETPFYLALCLGAFAAYARRGYSRTALFAGLAVLARPDGILVAVVLSLHFVMRIRKPVPWRAIAVFGAGMVAWFGFAWWYFGSPLPATLFAKQQQGVMAISQGFAPGLWTVFRRYLDWLYLPGAIACLTGVWELAFRARRWGWFLAWPVLYFLSYTALGVTRYFWYYAPLVPGLIVLLGLGVTRWRGMLRARGAAFSTAVAAVLLMGLFAAQAFDLLRMTQAPDRRVAIYTAIGKWLRDRTAPGDSVATLEVGVIGFYAQRPMVDFAGLIEPEISRQFRADTTYADSAAWALDRYHPRYLVLHDGWFPGLEQGYVAAHCAADMRFPGAEYGYSGDIVVYRCY